MGKFHQTRIFRNLLTLTLSASILGSTITLPVNANTSFSSLQPDTVRSSSTLQGFANEESATSSSSTAIESATSPENADAPAGNLDADYIDGEAVILLSEDAINQELDKNEKKLDKSLGKDIDVEATYSFEDVSMAAAVISSDNYSTAELIEQLSQSDAVAKAEPNYVFKATGATNDSYRNLQWYLQDDAHPDSDIDYDSSLNYTPTSTPVVAVVDTGVDASHPELASHIYGSNMYNSIAQTTVAFADENGHGTHIAGIIGATINNNSGITGIANAQILPVKCLNDEGEGSSQSVINAYYYLINLMQSGLNLKAINLSLGGFGSNSYILNQVITTAGQLGAITVCSSGNEATDINAKKSYPASYQNNYLISVGASSQNGSMASFSNYGQTDVDVFAPGTDIFSTASYSDFHPELSHEHVYNTFENASIDNIVIGDASGTVTLSNEQNFTLGGQNSVCWDITTVPNKHYYIAIPYTIENNINNESYLGMRFKVLQTSNQYSIAQNSLTFIDSTSASPTFDSVVNSISDELSTTSDYWIGARMAVSSKKSAKQAGTYYAILSIDAKVSASYKIYIDNLGVGSHLCKYTYESGTSMATPMVAGEIALLSSIYPNMSTEELRARVIGGVDVSANYAGKCTSSGKINIAKALSGNINPVINQAYVQNKNANILGYGFGSQAGLITLQNTTTQATCTPSILAWSDNTISVSLDNIPTGVYQVTVTRPDGSTHLFGSYLSYSDVTYVTNIALNKKSVTLAAGKQCQLSATVSPANAANKAVTYTSSNSKYATVDRNGLVTTKAAGKGHTVTITCTADDQNIIKTTCKIKITAPTKKLSLKKTQIKVKAGKKVRLKVQIKPAKASQKLRYTTSKKKYATVNKKGVVTTKKAGKGHTVRITCRATDGTKKKVVCKILLK